MEGNDLLQKYVTDTEGQVFAIKDLHGIVGAVMARYSRAETGLRETLLREFIKEDKLKLKKADKLIERVLIAYGDDSVGELEGAHLSFENISMLATKVIEHRRIGGSPIEQSTRYIRYDFKSEEGYHYYTPEHLPEEAQSVFRKHLDRIFDAYAKMWEPVIEHLEKAKPLEEATYDLGEKGSSFAEMASEKDQNAFRRTWQTDIKTKACDILRAFLPLATRANVGLFGNGRFFQNLISKMLTSNLAEANHLGQKAFDELTKVIPHYVKRSRKSDYLVNNDASMASIVAKYFDDLNPTDTLATNLVAPDNAFIAQHLAQGEVTADAVMAANLAQDELGYLASLVFAYARGSFCQIRDRIKTLSQEAREEVYAAYYGDRQTRRDRPERGLEFGYPYTFDLVTEWAVYKDLMRHRMGTIQVQQLVPDLGFVMPRELEDAGLADIARDAISAAEELYAYLDEHHPAFREYAILQGHKIRWLLGMNDRALMHMLELRTAPQGHPNYRLCCQHLHQLALERYPERASRMNFVNTEKIYWSRSDSEARQRVKEAQWENQHGSEE